MTNTTNENAASAPSEAQAAQWKSLQQRIATALVLLPAVGGIIWLGGWFLVAFIALIAIQMNREWEKIAPSGLFWRLLGLSYIALPCLSLIAIRNLDFVMSKDASLLATFYPLAMVITTDTGAYFCGKLIGGPKLAPRISPKKTWAGLLGGMASSTLIAVLLLPYMPWPETTLGAAFLGIAIALLGQAGDLFESWLKRRSGIKDSGSLLPGHGGLLDRLDGYVLVLPVYLGLLFCYAELLP